MQQGACAAHERCTRSAELWGPLGVRPEHSTTACRSAQDRITLPRTVRWELLWAKAGAKSVRLPHPLQLQGMSKSWSLLRGPFLPLPSPAASRYMARLFGPAREGRVLKELPRRATKELTVSAVRAAHATNCSGVTERDLGGRDARLEDIS